MRFVLVTLTFFISIYSFGQKDWTVINDLEKFFVKTQYLDKFWNKQKTENQVEKYHNNILQTYYIINDSIHLTRIDNSHYGGINLKAECFQKYKIDTIWQINPITLEDTKKIDSGYCDIYDGLFIDYKLDSPYFIRNYYWKSKDSTFQVDTFRNGKTKVFYEDLDSYYKIRFDFNEKGELYRKSKIHQVFESDTSMQINAISLEDEFVVQNGYVDKFDSILYYKAKLPKRIGYFRNNIQIGLWKLYNNGEMIEVLFNKKGELTRGKYQSYYLIENEVLGKKSKGHFRKKYFTYNNEFGLELKKVFYIKRGKWVYYNKDGSIKLITKY